MPKKDDAFPKADESVATRGPRTEREKLEGYARRLGVNVAGTDAELTRAIKDHLKSGVVQPVSRTDATRIEAKAKE